MEREAELNKVRHDEIAMLRSYRHENNCSLV